jgi:hypothetical protein
MTKTLMFILTVPGNEDILQNCLTSVLENTPEENYGLMIYKHNYKGFAVGIENDSKKNGKEHHTSL